VTIKERIGLYIFSSAPTAGLNSYQHSIEKGPSTAKNCRGRSWYHGDFTDKKKESPGETTKTAADERYTFNTVQPRRRQSCMTCSPVGNVTRNGGRGKKRRAFDLGQSKRKPSRPAGPLFGAGGMRHRPDHDGKSKGAVCIISKRKEKKNG